MSKMGRPSKGDRRKVSVPLEVEIYQELKVHCAATGKEMGEVIGQAFGDWWQTQDQARKDAREFIAKKNSGQAA